MDETAESRPSANRDRRYVVSLTGMRGIAALLVFLFHYGALHPGIRLDLAVPLVGRILQFPLGFGYAGVDIFFVLSGFLLTLPFARTALDHQPRPKLGHYFKRRFLRVFPAYYAQLIIILIVGSWFLTWTPLAPLSLAAHLLMFFNIGWDPVRPMVGVWWTLPVEMGFYLLLPLLAPFLRPARWVPVLVLGIMVSMGYRFWAAAHFGEFGAGAVFLAASQLPGFLSEFLFGASAALIAERVGRNDRVRPAAWVLDLMFIFGLLIPAVWLWQVVLSAGADYWMGHWAMIVAPSFLGLTLSMAVLALYWGSRVGTFLLANRAVYFLGLISYSLYLWHFVVIQQVQLLFADSYASLSHWVTFPLNAMAAIGVASISYYLVERPFYRLKSFSQVKAG